MRFILVVTLFFSSFLISAQSNRLALVNPINKTVDLKVVVLDEENAMEPLAFATVIVKEKGQEKTTNLEGEFKASLRPGTYNIEIQFIGYQTITLSNVTLVSGKPVELKTSMRALQLEPSVNFDEYFSEKSDN
jgi:uncharacterized membrane protein